MRLFQNLPSQSQRIKADLLLLLVAIIWGSAFVAQRVAAQELSVYLFNGLRFILGAATLILFQSFLKQAVRKPRLSDLPWISLAGALLFLGTSFQQIGLITTTAANAGFITGLYVVIIPLILGLVLRRALRPVIWLASLLAAAGLFLLSTGGEFVLAIGDAWELAGAFMWALHVILIGWLVQRVDIFPLAVIQYLVCALLSLAAGWAIGELSWLGLQTIWWTILYTGILSVGLGYTLQAVAQKTAPPADAAILLSGEAVFAAVAGWWLLDERLAVIQLVGCGLMLAGMLLAQGLNK